MKRHQEINIKLIIIIVLGLIATVLLVVFVDTAGSQNKIPRLVGEGDVP